MRASIWVLLGALSVPLGAQMNVPRVGVARYQDGTFHTVQGLPANMIVADLPLDRADAASFSDGGGLIWQGGVVRLADGSLAGSTLTMDQALRNLLSLGLPLAAATGRLSTVPADYLGVSDRGRLVVGAAADVVVVDATGALLAVVTEGVAV